MTALSSISIRSFQSLHSVDLALSPFTVIVGPSSSGKSAFVRALATLVRNQRGTAFITQGKPACSISASVPSGSISLTRSKSSSTDAYVLNQQRFTKLGGSTPAEVTAALGQIADPTAIAAQFDPPYLLTQSPAEAARTLASLTGSHLLLEGAREANRQRLEASGTLRTRTADQQSTSADLARYPNHQAHTAALDRAATGLTDARAAQHRLATLDGLISSIDQRAHTVRTLRSALQSLPKLPTDDDLAAASTVADKISALRSLLDQINALARSIRAQRTELDGLDLEVQHATERYSDTLHALGVCPTCGAPTVQA